MNAEQINSGAIRHQMAIDGIDDATLLASGGEGDPTGGRRWQMIPSDQSDRRAIESYEREQPERCLCANCHKEEVRGKGEWCRYCLADEDEGEDD